MRWHSAGWLLVNMVAGGVATAATLLVLPATVVLARAPIQPRSLLMPGGLGWTSRLGHTYQRRPLTIIDSLPDPIPRDQPNYPLAVPPDDGWELTEIWENPPPEPDPPPEPGPPSEPDPSTDDPPF